MSKPNESVIYKSYTGKLSTTMEARRSRLERMQTLPNIKLISSTPSRTTVLDSTPEIPSDVDDATAGTQQRQRRSHKTLSFVKRMSEGRFFVGDRSPCRSVTSAVLGQSPLLASSTPTSMNSDAFQLQQLHATLQSAAQSAGVAVACQQLKDADNDEVGTGGGGAVVENSAAAKLTQTPADSEGRLDQSELLRVGDEPSVTADDDALPDQ